MLSWETRGGVGRAGPGPGPGRGGAHCAVRSGITPVTALQLKILFSFPRGNNWRRTASSLVIPLLYFSFFLSVIYFPSSNRTGLLGLALLRSSETLNAERVLTSDCCQCLAEEVAECEDRVDDDVDEGRPACKDKLKL